MPRLISLVRGKHCIEFDKGSFDEWCVYLTLDGGKRYAPRDTEYFTRLAELNEQFGAHNIYSDFVRIYDVTTAEVKSETLQLISALAAAYGNNAEEMEVLFTILYAGMVAEENKHKAILRKRIKRLGMHQVLIEKMPPDEAAKFSLGKKHTELDVLMKERGF